MSQQNRIALVTGAAQGLGLASATALALAGNRVVATDLAGVDLSLFPEECWSRVMAANLDVTDRAMAAEVFAKIGKDWGPVGILVNNAGVAFKLPDKTSAMATNVSDEEWEKTIAVNLTSVLTMTQLAVPQMRDAGWGRVINMASLAGRTRSRISGAAYSSTKAGVIGVTRVMANDLGPLGITANCVAPGRILTPMAMLGRPEVNEAYAEQIPVRRLGTVEEVAAVVAFLASEITGFINGAIIDINGGYFMP